MKDRRGEYIALIGVAVLLVGFLAFSYSKAVRMGVFYYPFRQQAVPLLVVGAVTLLIGLILRMGGRNQ